MLYQDNRIALDCDLRKPENLVEILELFFEHRQPHEVDWEEAVLKFSEKIPDLAGGVTTILEAEHKKNADFRAKFQAFADLCRQSINPDLTDDAIHKMLVQHLLTERIFRKVFNNQEFLSRNVIAAEIEKVIRSITNRHFSRDEFLKPRSTRPLSARRRHSRSTPRSSTSSTRSTKSSSKASTRSRPTPTASFTPRSRF